MDNNQTLANNDPQVITLMFNKGVNRDAPPGSLAEGYSSDIRHMRFDDDVVMKMPGLAVFFATIAAGAINGIYSFTGGTATTMVIRATQTTVSKLLTAGATELGNPVFVPTGLLTDRWTFSPWGSSVLLTNGVDPVKIFASPYDAANLTTVSADATLPVAHVVRTFQRHAFLLGQPTYPFRVSWSDIDVCTGATSWTASAANEAGSIDLYEAKTPVVGGDTLKSIFVVYTSDQIHTFQYVGGNYVFSRQIADRTVGLWSRCLLVSTEDAQFFMSPTNFHAFDGTKPVPIGKGIRKEIYAGIAHAVASHSGSIDNAFAFHVRDKGEVWFCVPVNAASPDLACVFNYWNGSWSLEDLYSDTATTNPHTAGLANAGIDQGPTPYPLLSLNDKYIYSLGSGQEKALVAATTAYTGYIDSPEFDGGDPEAVKHILKIIPDITSTAASIGFRIGSRDTRNSGLTWTPALADAATGFDPDSDKHVNIRASGRLLRLRVETSAAASPFTINKIQVLVQRMGSR